MANEEDVPSYEELLDQVARDCEGFSGASLAGVARAAASHALERSVTGFSTSSAGSESMLDCLVTKEDLQLAIADVNASSGDSDWASYIEPQNATSASSPA
jgi:SpoVK/Ycf46/Vps4 family AAA+-type ATPase